MTAPKNDKARKAWLAGLKDKSVVAVLDDRGSVTFVGQVTFYSYAQAWSINGRRYTVKTGKRSGSAGWIVPATDAMKTALAVKQAADRARDKLSRIGWQWTQFTDDQILAVSAILWPEQSK